MIFTLPSKKSLARKAKHTDLEKDREKEVIARNKQVRTILRCITISVHLGEAIGISLTYSRFSYAIFNRVKRLY